MIGSPWVPLLWSLVYLAACVVMVIWHLRLRRWQNNLQELLHMLMRHHEHVLALHEPPETATCTQCGTPDLTVFWREDRDGTVLCEACYAAAGRCQGGEA